MSWTEILTALVAFYGALLSTAIFIKEQKTKTRQLEVKISNGFLKYGQKLSELMMFVEVFNPGNRAVQVNLPKLILPDNRTLVFPNYQGDVQFPHELQEGKSCKIWIAMKAIGLQLHEAGFKENVKLYAGVSDGTGKEYRSKKYWKYDLDQELNRE